MSCRNKDCIPGSSVASQKVGRPLLPGCAGVTVAGGVGLEASSVLPWSQ